MRHVLFFSCIYSLSISNFNLAQKDLSSPSSILGYEIGERFTRHSDVVDYFKSLVAQYPDNMIYSSYGKTYEQRELMAVYISSEENLRNLEAIKLNHLNRENEKVNIVWLSYNVHGNESSGTEAAMQTAWELLQAPNKAFLENTLVIMDPCMNPDGRDRYVNFYNQYGSLPHNLDAVTIEHNETWPGGRPNHYLFDLNRDWAWMTQIESQQRVSLYNQWMPHVHVDFHEQGINDPYYFPPAAEPYHDVITDWQREFQMKIGKNHAKHFDNQGWLYFSKEIFDLLYPSYGDTYPMFSGSIGMTYEQGGSHRGGLAVITSIGDTLSLVDRVKHHVKAGISTVETSSNNAKELIHAYQIFNSVDRYKYKSFVVKGIDQRVSRLLELLDKNNIEYYQASNGFSTKGFSYAKQEKESIKLDGSEYIITVDQSKGALVEVLFEPKTNLTDSLTYDISAWTLPYAYEVDCWAAEDLIDTEKLTKGQRNSSKEIELNELPYGYVVEWNSMESACFLSEALMEGVKVHYNEKAFEVDGISYQAGSLIVLTKEQNGLEFPAIFKSLLANHKVSCHTLNSGFVDKGLDMGSSSVHTFSKSKIGMFVGENFSSLNIGEVWHFFEQELQYPIHLIWERDLDKAFENMDILIYPEGQSELVENQALKDWVRNGGHLIVLGSSVSQFNSKEMGVEQIENKHDSLENIPYAQRERHAISSTIIGAIYDTELDKTHPMCFGLGAYHTLRLSSSAVKLNNAAIKIAPKARSLNGFVGYRIAEIQQNSAVAGWFEMGRGKVTYLPDNPVFRGFWEQGKLLFSNALFFK